MHRIRRVTLPTVHAIIRRRTDALASVRASKFSREARMSVHAVGAPRASIYTGPPTAGRALSHIPGDDGWPILGHTLPLLADPKGFVEGRAKRHGLVYRSRAFGQSNVSLLGPEANELVLLDSQKIFSSMMGWDVILGRLFPRGLMLLDFDEHRVHRRALAVAFKSGPMRSYLSELNAGMARGIAQWPRGKEFKFYPAIKQLTLDLAATSFLGEELGPELEMVKQAFIAMLASSIAVVRVPLPGTKMRRGLKGRAALVDYFNRRIPLRRERSGDDLFSHLCRATWDDGSLLSNSDIINHMIFLMLAAHDTLTSSFTSFVYRLAASPQWQEAARAELDGLGLDRGESLPFERLDDLPLTEMAFKEAMRMAPPVPSLPRRAVRDFEFKGFRIPAGTGININPLFTHFMAEIWPEPDRYDPERFTLEASRGRHKFAYVPFGGGAHMCLGLNFAYMQAKCFAWHFLGNVRVSIAPDYRPEWRMWPIPAPRDGLSVTLNPL
jgi:cytochrome P450